MNGHTLKARRLGIDTHKQPVLYMREDCPVCRAEGLEAHARVAIRGPGSQAVAVLNVVRSDLLAPGEAGLSEETWRQLGVPEGTPLQIGHAPVLESFGQVRTKIFGGELSEPALRGIVADIAAGLYPDTHLASFLTACAGGNMAVREITHLTRAMIDSGQTLTWGEGPVVDKHCVGGLPGNRTTPIVVALVAAAGLTIPKTSSRAITSPAGTADVVETMTPVSLTLPRMRRVVEQEGGCMVWGGAVDLSPVDDRLILVERALDLDSEGQLVASVLSKKAAAGSTHVLIDLPWGPTAKVRTLPAAAHLARDLREVGAAVGLSVTCMITDGSQPVGRGLGPALEAWDVLRVLRCAPEAPADLRERALALATRLVSLGQGLGPVEAAARVRELLDSGAALARFHRICDAQGGFREPPVAAHTQPILAPRGGVVMAVDNRRLARAAKLAGAPADPAAGLVLHVSLGDRVDAGQPLFSLHAESAGELSYASDYLTHHPDVFTLAEPDRHRRAQ